MGRYWREHVRAPVCFEQGIRAAAAQGVQVFVELGPHPVLSGLGRATLAEGTQRWLPSLRRGRGEWAQLLESLGELYVSGAKVNWSGFDAPYARRKLSLPTYPFQRERYWVDKSSHQRIAPALHTAANTSLLGIRVDSPAVDGVLFISRMGPNTAAEFALEHRVFGVPIL